MVFVFLLLCIGVCVAHAVHDGLKYTQSHEWVKTTGDVATVGITDHAQASELAGDIINTRTWGALTDALSRQYNILS